MAIFTSIRSTLVAVFTFGLFTAPTLHAGNDAIVVFGASGKIGGLIVQDALDRGHSVVGVSRNPSKLSFDSKNFKAKTGDVTDVDSVRSLAEGANTIIISVSGTGQGNLPHKSVVARAAFTMIEAFSGKEDAPRIIQVGGATTMHPTIEDMQANLPFPAEPGSPMHSRLFAHKVALNAYKTSSIPWTVLTPPKKIMGWSFTGLKDAKSSRDSYRTSTESHVLDAEGKSSIFVKDLARAAIDEAENRKFVGQRFTVGY
jgi:putative NADH-flavin reductase